jgi:hypothetical protein
MSWFSHTYFELADAHEKDDGTIEELWKCFECEHQVKRVKERVGPIESDDEVEEKDGNEFLDALQEHHDRKKARIAPPSAYRSVKHVYSNIVERPS